MLNRNPVLFQQSFSPMSCVWPVPRWPVLRISTFPVLPFIETGPSLASFTLQETSSAVITVEVGAIIASFWVGVARSAGGAGMGSGGGGGGSSNSSSSACTAAFKMHALWRWKSVREYSFG
jgi:hypothetical protein